MKILYTILFVVIVGLAVYFGFVWFGGNESGPTLVFDGPEEVLVGVPFDLDVGVSNQFGEVLRDAKISLALPKGVVFVGQGAEENLSSRHLGDLGVGSLSDKSFKLMVVNNSFTEAEDIDIKVYVDYSLELLGPRFKDKEKWQTKVAESAVQLSVLAPDKITSGADIQMKINYENISDEEVNNLFIEIDYPSAFEYKNSNLLADKNDSYWQLGKLKSGSENDLIINGRLVGMENSAHSFRARLGMEWGGESYILDEQIINTAIKVAPLALEILTNNVSEYVASPGELINYSVNYSYLGELADSAILKVSFFGTMFEKNGEEMVWRLNKLKQEGSVSFSARVRDDYIIRRLGDRNFVLGLEARFDDGDNVAVAESENKVSGKVDLRSASLFRDADSGILNKGSFPPKVGQLTEYTIHWTVINYSNDVRDLEIRAELPDYVKFTETVKSNDNSSPAFDGDTGEVVWEIGRMSATRGVIGTPLEAVFQVSAIPSSETAGQYLPLVKNISLSAVDEFTGLPLSASASVITTRLTNDKTVIEGEGRVVR